jgi:hypothetical protein
MLVDYTVIRTTRDGEVLRRTAKAAQAAAWQKAQAQRVKAGEPAVTPSKAPGSFWVLGTPSVEVVS